MVEKRTALGVAAGFVAGAVVVVTATAVAGGGEAPVADPPDVSPRVCAQVLDTSLLRSLDWQAPGVEATGDLVAGGCRLRAYDVGSIGVLSVPVVVEEEPEESGSTGSSAGSSAGPATEVSGSPSTDTGSAAPESDEEAAQRTWDEACALMRSRGETVESPVVGLPADLEACGTLLDGDDPTGVSRVWFREGSAVVRVTLTAARPVDPVAARQAVADVVTATRSALAAAD
ncbi:hypothetical protein [Nocardioides kribbensis]|uniref:hypothetical protein n=1 Tax=Nocardioides kribbensis TaxID=305517 RepID=UPI0032D9F896